MGIQRTVELGGAATVPRLVPLLHQLPNSVQQIV